MAEDVWAQDPNLLQFFDGSLPQSIWVRHMNGLPLWLSEKIIQYQSFLWLPLSIFLGRLAIFLTSFKKCQNMTERILQVIHVIWFCAFLYSCFPSWKSALSFYFLVNVGEGIFHVQLLVNHYLKPWHDLSEIHGTGNKS
jgi:delta8-fatty-acid desaturase